MAIIRRIRIAAALTWALVPLTVFGGLPRMGCICANGQHKFFCQRRANEGPDGSCNCCDGKSAPRSQAGTPACCRCSHRTCASHSPTARSERPCRPVLDNPVFLTGGKITLDLDHTDASPVSAGFEPLPATVPDFVAAMHHRELLPPPDLVVTLGVLLI